jgi:RTX calcium-binding nonapeptide repeat (4 copies)/Divergent InlB B-repeat domain
MATAIVTLASASGASAATHSECDGPCRFDVRKLGTGQGMVEGANGRIQCGQLCTAETDYEEPVYLIATPATGSVFTGWVGDCVPPVAGNRCDIRMNNGPITFFAVFDRIGDPPTPLEEPSSVPPLPPPPPYQPLPGAANPRGCTVVGTPGNDDLDGTPGRDVVCGLGGADHLHGGGGNDVLYGDGGNDVLEAHGGNDILHGGRGHDLLAGGTGRDDLRARDGARDTLHGGRGRDTGRVDRFDRARALERRVR